METGSARVMVAADNVGLGSEEVAADSVDPLLSVEGLDSVDPLLTVEAPLAVADFVDMVPESLPPGAFVCGRCHLIHEDREARNHAHSKFWPCSRCGLVHREYWLGDMLYSLDEFDCELFLPDLDNVVMDGNSIVLPPHVIKKIDEFAAKKDHAKATQE